MKRLVCLLVSLALAASIRAASVRVGGTVGAGAYQLSLSTEQLSFTLADGMLSTAAITLGNELSIKVGKQQLSSFFSTLGSRRMQVVTVAGRLFTLSLLHDVYRRPALIVSWRSLQLGVLPPAGPPFLESTPLLMGRWCCAHKRARLLLEGSWSADEGLLLYQHITAHFGPVTVVTALGPETGEREAQLKLGASSEQWKANVFYSQSLGVRPLYSGEYQVTSRSLETSLSYRSTIGTFALSHTRKLTSDESAHTEISQKWQYSYRYQQSEISCTISEQGIVLASKEKDRSFTLSEAALGVRWRVYKSPWCFEIGIKEGGRLTVLWEVTTTTDRGS